jgi:hypothetical protein
MNTRANWPALPLLPWVSKFFGSIDLSDVAIVACQHILGTQLRLFDELVLHGLAPQNLFLIGKVYSTNEEVFREFIRRGVNISPHGQTYDSHVSFDEQFTASIAKFLDDIQLDLYRSRPKRIIVLDVGGQLLSAWVSTMASQPVPVVGIEQTSSGFHFMEDWSRRHATVDVARSAAKTLEARFIADLACNRIDEYVARAGLTAPAILVIGQGAIGNCLKGKLREKYRVSGFDRLPEKSDLQGDLRNHFGGIDLVVGATGGTAFRALDCIRAVKAYHFISLSSSDREFSAVDLRRYHPRTSNPHVDISVGSVHIVNGGFPINFDGSNTSLPPERAQLVVSLILAAIYQAAEQKPEPGIIDLESSTQQSIVIEFNRLSESSENSRNKSAREQLKSS